MIPTAEEFRKTLLKQKGRVTEEEFMIEFAKLHCEAQAKAIVEKITLNSVEYAKYRSTVIKTENLGQEVPTEDSQVYIQADSNSILTAYPLSNIQ
jgi:hypothetical protein